MWVCVTYEEGVQVSLIITTYLLITMRPANRITALTPTAMARMSVMATPVEGRERGIVDYQGIGYMGVS